MVAHTLKPGHDKFSTWLILENVGPGAATNVEFKILEGINYKMRENFLLRDWAPTKNGLSVMPSGQKIDTILGSLVPVAHGVNKFLTTRIVVSITYHDIEGKKYGPIQFEIEKDPLHGSMWKDGTFEKVQKDLGNLSKSVSDIVMVLRDMKR